MRLHVFRRHLAERFPAPLFTSHVAANAVEYRAVLTAPQGGVLVAQAGPTAERVRVFWRGQFVNFLDALPRDAFHSLTATEGR
jgi:hypothetical protein